MLEARMHSPWKDKTVHAKLLTPAQALKMGMIDQALELANIDRGRGGNTDAVNGCHQERLSATGLRLHVTHAPQQAHAPARGEASSSQENRIPQSPWVKQQSGAGHASAHGPADDVGGLKIALELVKELQKDT